MAKKKTDVFYAGRRVSELLDEIGRHRKNVQRLEDAAADQMRIINEYAALAKPIRQAILDCESEIKSICSHHEPILFAGSDRLEVPAGVVVRSVKKWVVRIRGIVDALKSAGRSDLVRVAESADWDAVDKLSDADLGAIGTRRELRTDFSYELKEAES